MGFLGSYSDEWQTVSVVWDVFDEPVALQQAWGRRSNVHAEFAYPKDRYRYVPLSTLDVHHEPLIDSGVIEGSDRDRDETAAGD